MKIQWKQGKVTTILAIIGIVLTAMVFIGWLTAGDKQAIMDGITNLFNLIGTGATWEAITLAIVSLLAIVLHLFVKDPPSTPPGVPGKK